MGDVIHALPAAASLKASFPKSHLAWVIRPRWAPLLENNRYVDEVIPFNRTRTGAANLWKKLRAKKFDLVVDLQGLIQSAMVAKGAGAREIVGFAREQAREKLASLAYSKRVLTEGPHRVDSYLQLARAAGAKKLLREFPLPMGLPEGSLPSGNFVLASPFAGWGSKQWPIEYYSELARSLDIPLVVNGAPSSQMQLSRIQGATIHLSGILGLIDATRRASAVIGLDSGPMHLAAALNKPGVALFGPTDPLTHGPYGGSLRVIRRDSAVTSYKRREEIDESMRSISPEQVREALEMQIA
jgi:heptosyltransferase-1